ncbi:hypothetical protein K501DRAFT_270239 [Backusella circina FSU 941]|nr:hypothetical protein K501DRAFT_270239 [Backusella circina FSU 941]
MFVDRNTLINAYVERNEILRLLWVMSPNMIILRKFGQKLLNFYLFISNLTTGRKRLSNGSRPHTIGLKTDARIITNLSIFKTDLVDVSTIEAVKGYAKANKMSTNKSKLAIQSKCIVDNIASNCDQRVLNNVSILNIQISAIEAEAYNLALVDSGVYVYTFAFDLSLPSSIELFSTNMIKWLCGKLGINFH